MPKTFSIDEAQKLRFAAIFLLEKMVNQRRTWSTWLEGNDTDLEPILEHLVMKDLVGLQNNRYAVTAKGKQALSDFMARYTDFLKNFDVFFGVDLEEGEFAMASWNEIEDDAEWETHINDERWEDLRVTVADYKGIDPVEIVFMSFLNEERLSSDKEGWQFDLLLGSTWDDILEICNTALSMDDLGYEDVSGEDVLRDVMTQGAELNIQLQEEEAQYGPEAALPTGSFGNTPPPVPGSAPPPIPGSGPTPVRQGGGSFMDRVQIQKPHRSSYDAYRDPRYVNPVWRKKWWDD